MFDLSAYTASPEFAANISVFSKIAIALLLGLIVGYERTYHGRAAGMRTFGLVCMASAALTIIGAYHSLWFDGMNANLGPIDPTRVVQGIVTGIGFLGAGIIMKDGYSISGLTTAAAIWASSAIGVLVGLDFILSAVLFALLSTALMMMGVKFETWLPSRPTIAVAISFVPNFVPSEEALRTMLNAHGYIIARNSIAITHEHGKIDWRFVAISIGKTVGAPLTSLSRALAGTEGIACVKLSLARN